MFKRLIGLVALMLLIGCSKSEPKALEVGDVVHVKTDPNFRYTVTKIIESDAEIMHVKGTVNFLTGASNGEVTVTKLTVPLSSLELHKQ
jgi:hypothetical protein